VQLTKNAGIKLATAIATVAVVALAITGCSPSQSSGTSGSSGRFVNIYTGNPGAIPQNFNPFSGSVYWSPTGAILGSVYEPLFYYNTAKNEAPQPWLAKSFTTSADGKTYDVTLRSGVTWQDGKPFTAADVAFTYNLIKKNPATNVNGLKLAGATATDDTHVKITLTQPDYTNEFPLLGETFIVPQHLWKSVKDPAKYLNTKPVGTGAFSFGDYTNQSFTVVKNPDYYIKGEPSVPGLRFVSETGNTGGLNALNAGKVDWAGIALEDVKKSFLDKDPKYNKDVVIPADVKVLVMNLTKAPFNDLAFRKAISLSIDRDAIIKQAFGGTDTPANPTSLLQPRDAAYTAAEYKGKTMTEDLAAAKKALSDAGYKKDGSGHLLGKDGKPIAFTISTVTGYTDTITANQLLVEDFEKLGIQATSKQLSLGAYSTAQSTGDFDMLDDRIATGPTPFQQFNSALNYSLSAPIGKTASADYARFDDPKVQALLEQAASTDDQKVVHSAYEQLGTYFAENQPYILLSQNGAVSTYRDQYFTGWPTNDDLWANPSNWIAQNVGWVAKKLKPRS
jgi:peptide/nickel transport system substrate-binding protein